MPGSICDVLPAAAALLSVAQAVPEATDALGVTEWAGDVRRVGVVLRAEPELVYGYTAELDTAAHMFGFRG